MELSKIIIKNFRSIKEAEIIFDHNCLILLGKNEAGKSNVLKAVAALFEEYTVSNKDKRKKIDNEIIEDYCVMGVFKLSEQDVISVVEKVCENYSSIKNIVQETGGLFKSTIGYSFKEILICLNIDEKPIFRFSSWRDEKDIIESIFETFFKGHSLTTDATGKFKIDLYKAIMDAIEVVYDERPYQCHYWQYSDSYLLPNSVIINNFIANPSSCKALENIFMLCNRENIKQEFADAMSQDGDYANLLEQISKAVTKTFQSIWNDFKDTSIQLQPNGSEILIKVVNKAKYSFEDRSDGFKKFISILLMLSTKARANKLGENDIILIDEPDQSLYPTSARFLRDELLGIGKKSKVIYSTHSQYMIDSSCLDRHIIVEKVADVTKLKKETGNAPFSNDELLRRAIGSSIFECLQSKNIIFEGWLDKELFSKYCKFEETQKQFENYGKVYLGGISGVETLVQLLILANKKFLIIADSDTASKSKRNEFVKNYPEYKDTWCSYDDVVENVSTMEDFINADYIAEQINEFGYTDYKYDTKANAIQNIDNAVRKDKEKKQEIKNALINNVSKDRIRSDYAEFVEYLRAKLENL